MPANFKSPYRAALFKGPHIALGIGSLKFATQIQQFATIYDFCKYDICLISPSKTFV
jgi:hypothetical protein